MGRWGGGLRSSRNPLRRRCRSGTMSDSGLRNLVVVERQGS